MCAPLRLRWLTHAQLCQTLLDNTSWLYSDPAVQCGTEAYENYKNHAVICLVLIIVTLMCELFVIKKSLGLRPEDKELAAPEAVAADSAPAPANEVSRAGIAPRGPHVGL
jgi:hypothetical protein